MAKKKHDPFTGKSRFPEFPDTGNVDQHGNPIDNIGATSMADYVESNYTFSGSSPVVNAATPGPEMHGVLNPKNLERFNNGRSASFVKQVGDG